MKKQIVLFLFLLCSLSALADDKALLIGIDNYKYNNEWLQKTGRPMDIEGCANDAQSIRIALSDKLGFGQENIRLLLNSEATRDNIINSIEQLLIEGTQPGDMVVISFAGHGSQIPDKDNDEPDDKDETILPYDTNPFTAENEITDDEIRELLSRLRGREVFLIFDSCHSGTITRAAISRPTTSSGLVRYLPPYSQIENIFKDKARAIGSSYQVSSGKPLSGVTARALSQRQFIDEMENNHVVISAAAPHQIAQPVSIKGKWNGALTYCIVQGMEGSSDLNQDGKITYEELFEFSRDRMREFDLPDPQDPQLDGNSSLFSRGLIYLSTTAPVTELIDFDNPLAKFKVKVWVTEAGKSIFRYGEETSFYVESEKDGYLSLIDIASDDSITVLFPNKYQQDNRIQAGRTYRVPAVEADFIITAQPPAGADTVLAVVTTRPIDLLHIADWSEEELFKAFEAGKTRALVRDMTWQLSDEQIKPYEWAVGKIRITVRE